MNRESILIALDLPSQFGATLLLLGLVLVLSPYLSGHDFGFLKIPTFPEQTRRRLRVYGPIAMVLAIAIHIPAIRGINPDVGEVAQATKSECKVSGIVFDSDSNTKLSGVKIDVYRDMSDVQQRPLQLMKNVATTGPDGEFSFSCGDIDEEVYPILLAARHRDWVATRLTGPKIARPSTWSDLKIAIPISDIDLKPLRDVRVSFSSREIDGNKFIVGEVENKTDRSFDCIELKFELRTSYQDKLEGHPVKKLGVVGVDVRNLSAGETRPYRKTLPMRAGFGLSSKREC